MKPAIVLHKSPRGKLTVVSATEDITEALEAYKLCTKRGEVFFYAPSFTSDRRKRNP